MFANSFGNFIRLSTFGESHGRALGLILDGLPSGFSVDWEKVNIQLDRRRPGQSKLSTPRKEPDQYELLSGVYEEKTTGVPLAAVFYNKDADSSKYDNLKDLFRPSHADFSYMAKYGHRDHRGGGRSSARETVSRVFAGSICEQVLESFYPVKITAWVQSVQGIECPELELVSRDLVDQNLVRCPDPETAKKMEDLITAVRKKKDTLGGTVKVRVSGFPCGRGEPVFDRLEARLAYAMLSLPAAKGFEIGSGFSGTLMTGSEHNDPFVGSIENPFATEKNHAGGTLGGISTGMDLQFSIAFKPVATHFQSQKSLTTAGQATEFAAKGRHDPCVLPRAIPIVEAMTALTLLDFELAHRARNF